MAETPGTVRLVPVSGMPEVRAGDDVATLVLEGLDRAGLRLRAGDIVVVSSKVVSKAMGLRAGDRAAAVADATVRVVAERATAESVTRVVEAVAGPVMAAAGVDASNTGGTDDVLVLPADPDAAAGELRDALAARVGLSPNVIGVVVTDTAGRPWRAGQTDFALGAVGVVVLDDLRGATDADGRPLAVTARAVADEIAAAADLVKGKASAVPVALVRGLSGALSTPAAPGARDLVRTGPTDWFRLGHVEAVRAALGVEPGSADSAAVGLRPLHAEELSDRVARAVRLALHGASGVRVDVGSTPAPVGITLSAGDGYALGRVVARLEAALWAEDLLARVETCGPSNGEPDGDDPDGARSLGSATQRVVVAVEAGTEAP